MYGRGYQTGGVGFGPPVTPTVIKQLLIANVGVHLLASLALPNLYSFGAVVPAEFWTRGHLWQPFTYMWLHAPGLWHLAGNMFGLWMFGSPLAMAWGEKRFLRYYLICGVGAGLVIATLPYVLGQSPFAQTLGASGAVFGVLLAYSLTWPDRTIMLLFPPIPLKAIYLIPLLLFIEFTAYGNTNISHAGHLGGVVVGWLLLRREGSARGLFSLERLKFKWNRYKMRRRLRAVRDDDRDRDQRGPWVH